MSSSDKDPHLTQWLSTLDKYRQAIHSSPGDASNAPFEILAGALQVTNLGREVIEETASDTTMPEPARPIVLSTPSHLSAPSHLSTPSQFKRPVSLVEHLPIDGLLKRMHRSKSFVLGIGSIGKADPQLVRSIVNELVTRCSMKTDRKAILVSIVAPGSVVTQSPLSNGNYQEAIWTYYGHAKADTKTWHAQLGALPRWKQEFGLIVLDLGDASAPPMPRIGRLCDGVVLQLFNSNSSRETIRALKSLQSESLPFLGAWSVGINARRLAA